MQTKYIVFNRAHVAKQAGRSKPLEMYQQIARPSIRGITATADNAASLNTCFSAVSVYSNDETTMQ